MAIKKFGFFFSLGIEIKIGNIDYIKIILLWFLIVLIVSCGTPEETNHIIFQMYK